MKRSLLLPAIAAALLTASPLFALRIGHTRADGYPVVIPSVRKLTPADGLFELPAKLGVAAPAGLNWQPLRRWYAATVPNGAAEAVGKGANCRFTLTAKGVPASVEGYRLTVAPDGITVAARDVRGLFYGMQTLTWFLRNRADDAALKCCTVEDWPDLEMRGVLYELNRISPSKTDRLCEVIDALGAMKYNMIMTDFGDNFPLSIAKEFDRPQGTFTKNDIKKIIAAAKRNNIEIIPYLQVASHTWWMTRHKNWEKLVEGKLRRDWNSTYCLSNPEVNRIVHTVITETAEMIKPRYFNLCVDELHETVGVCPKCRGKDKAELLLSHLLPIQKLLLDRGIAPMVYQDQMSIDPFRPKNTYVPVLDRLDHRTVVVSWQYEINVSPAVYLDCRNRGFNVVYMSWMDRLSNTMNLPKLAARCGAKGCIVSYWLTLPASFDNFADACANGYPATVCQAVYGWKSSEKDYVQLPFDAHREIRRLLDPAGVPVFRTPGVPLPIDGAFNLAISTGDRRYPQFDAKVLAKLKRELADDPARFSATVEAEKLCALVLSGAKGDGLPDQPVTIPVGTAVDGASFLLAAAPYDNFLFKRIPHPAVGDLTIRYTDGSYRKIPLRFGYNINEWNSYTGTYDARLTVRVNDAAGSVVNFYSLDWRNPMPKKVVKEIVFSTRQEKQIAPMLFGISLYGAKGKAVGAPGNGKSAAVAAPAPPALHRRMVADFESGSSGAMGISFSGTDKPIRKSFPVIPGRGKVLQLTLPPLKSPLGHGRLIMDIPIPPDGDFETVGFDFRFDHPELVRRTDFYIMDKAGHAAKRFLKYDRGFNDSWQSVRLPQSALVAKEYGGVERGNYGIMRIAFWLFNQEPVIFQLDNVCLIKEGMPGRYDIQFPVEETPTAVKK